MKTLTYIRHFFTAATVSLVLVVGAFGAGVLSITFLQGPAILPTTTLFPAAITLDPARLHAQAAIVYDPTDGRILYAKNADRQLPLASLTKLMTAEIVLSHAATTSVRITKKDLEPMGDWGLRVGDLVPLFDLLQLGLIASSNDAMAAAAASVGDNYVETMNSTAHTLGLTKTQFYNATGLDESADMAGGYGSAYDVARLAAAFFAHYPSYFALTTHSKVTVGSTGRTLSAPATAAPLLNLPGLVGAKTGYTDLAGGNLVAIFDIEIGHPIVAVVLGSTESGRFDDIRTLASAIRTP